MSNYVNRIENVTNIIVSDINTVNNMPKYLNTYNATATVTDIAEGQTAYVNGQQITGALNIRTHFSAYDENDLTYTFNNIDNRLDLMYVGQNGEDSRFIFDWKENSYVGTSVKYDNLASNIGLTSNIIKDGENILGVVGNYSGENTIPEGIFIQETQPTKTTNEAFWLNSIDKTDTTFANLIPAGLQVTANGTSWSTVRNQLTSTQLSLFNSATYILLVKFSATNGYIWASNNKPVTSRYK